MANEKKLPTRPKTGGAPKTIPGPTLREGGGSLPCGCKVAHDPEDKKLRYWFCPPHAVAYELLEVVQEAQTVLDEIVRDAPPELDTTAAMDLGIRTRRVLKKAKGDWR